MTTVYLVRHGQSLTNVEKVFTGRIDSALSVDGRKQAQAVKEFFDDIPLDAIYSSDLSRCVQTVEPVARAKKLNIVKESGFREIYSGLWQGKSFTDIAKLYPEDYNKWRNDLANCTPTGGESVAAMSERVFSAFERIVKANARKTTLICTHSVPIRAIVSIINYGSFSRIGESGWVPNGSVTEIAYNDGKYCVVECGKTAHLGDLITSLPNNI
ncbi:MAG: histidine phosphatase family protein [Christensenellaceae bacterium]